MGLFCYYIVCVYERINMYIVNGIMGGFWNDVILIIIEIYFPLFFFPFLPPSLHSIYFPFFFNFLSLFVCYLIKTTIHNEGLFPTSRLIITTVAGIAWLVCVKIFFSTKKPGEDEKMKEAREAEKKTFSFHLLLFLTSL